MLEFADFILQYPPNEQVRSCETRNGEVYTSVLERWDVPNEITDFPGVAQITRVVRETYYKNSKTKTLSVKLAITNLDLPAKELLEIDRSRWGIENKLHHTRDTVFLEDTCRCRLGAESLAVFRNALIGLFRQFGKGVLRQVRGFSARPIDLLRILKPK